MVSRRRFLQFSGVAATALVAAACGAVQTAPAAEEQAMEEKEAPKEAAQEGLPRRCRSSPPIAMATPPCSSVM